MAKESRLPGQAGAPTLDTLVAGATRAGDGEARGGLPPVHLWNPPFCGDIDMRIARDGTWFYGGTPIGRPALVRLFSTILRRDAERYVLVTPVEKVGIEVEDAPFLAVEMDRQDATLRLRTNVGDWVEAGADHPLRFEPGPSGGLKPYVKVRGDLWALVSRPVFYDLVAGSETREIDGVPTCGIASGGSFFPMMAAAELDRLAAADESPSS
ncbi:MAG TPA: DUF1285 domain-containing protein [Lichenihabitans sp.]|nr:DUF1285 domain-containing protein [Lichenihabitans sp.]